MYFLSKRGLVITFVLTLFFNCGGNKLPTVDQNDGQIFTPRKAYVVIRSEGGPEKVQKIRDILAAGFSENNVQTEYSLYKAKQAWNQNQIFNTAYSGKYDFIILIDQVAKFTIDNQTQIGGKYQIRSYHVKSPNPDWLDLGQSTCNLSVLPSIQKFSREVIRNIVGNRAVFKDHVFDYDDSIASIENTRVSPKDEDIELEMLRKLLEEEKEKTRLAEQERKVLENKLKLEVAAQKQRAKIAEIDAADAVLKKRQRQREIAERYSAKREELKKREAEKALKEPALVESTSKEPTREERISKREETKRKIAEEKIAKKRALVEANEARKEERRRLEELEREEKRRFKEEITVQRKEKERLAEEDLKRIKAKVAEERRQAEEFDRQQKENQRLAEVRKEEEKRQAKLREAQEKEQSRIEKEQAEALAIKERNARRIARAEESKRQEALLQAKRLEEKRLAEKRLAELEQEEKSKITEKNSNKNSVSKGGASTSSISPNAYVIIRGKEQDKKQFEDLQDYLEFNFMFVKAKSKTRIYNTNKLIVLTDILSQISNDHNIVILINQKEYLENGKYVYEIKRLNKQLDNEWNTISSEAYNLSEKADLKQLSKKITERLSN